LSVHNVNLDNKLPTNTVLQMIDILLGLHMTMVFLPLIIMYSNVGERFKKQRKYFFGNDSKERPCSLY
jgi:hypothetical protein